MIYRFQGFELDTARGLLLHGDAEIGLEPRAFSLLCHLVENRDRVITKDEAVEKVWGGRFITDAAISTAIKAVRRALGDDGVRQAAIRTLRGRGFRFVAAVALAAAAPLEADGSSSEPRDAGGQAGRPSVAVLPFRSMGRSEDHAAIADAVPAEIISSLSRLRWLKVFSRASSFRFRDGEADLEVIRSTLGAGYCLSGILEITSRGLAITVELTDARSMAVVWSDRFSGRIDDVHEMRSEIAMSVVTALELHIPLHEAEAARLRAPHSLDAWGLYHLGLQRMYRFNKADNVAAADCFDRAIALDPNFPRAHAARSFTSFQNAFLNYTRDREAEMRDARRFAERSVELDPLDPLGCFTLARAHWLEGDPEGGLGWLDRTVRYSPNFAHGHYARGWTAAIAGRGGDALDHVATAIDLSPLDPFLYAMQATRALAHLGQGDTARAALWGEHAARGPGAHYLIGMIAAATHQLNGDSARASYWARHAIGRQPSASLERFFQAFPFSDPKLRRELSDALRRSGIGG